MTANDLKPDIQLKSDIQSLRDCVNKLKENHPKYVNRPFTLDGHLLGTLGEVFAAQQFGLTLNENSVREGFDATKEGKKYQIKTTQQTGLSIKKPLEDTILIFTFIKTDQGKVLKITTYEIAENKISWNNDKTTYVGVQLLEKHKATKQEF